MKNVYLNGDEVEQSCGGICTTLLATSTATARTTASTTRSYAASIASTASLLHPLFDRFSEGFLLCLLNFRGRV